MIYKNTNKKITTINNLMSKKKYYIINLFFKIIEIVLII